MRCLREFLTLVQCNSGHIYNERQEEYLKRDDSFVITMLWMLSSAILTSSKMNMNEAMLRITEWKRISRYCKWKKYVYRKVCETSILALCNIRLAVQKL